jgi:hypothetical protein
LNLCRAKGDSVPKAAKEIEIFLKIAIVLEKSRRDKPEKN